MRLALVVAQANGMAIGDLALGVGGVLAVAAVIVVALKRKR
ncbi:hypothetical protein GCM10011609_15260 [Lentzea pudingi]|uniref:LPXTG cell wall anchor domain-containing protein n=1 Tax=Lentzea pudingi TaxID=1789439 RepID=A0ABQ2HHD7_9PSEU|nr:hypothetical protein [Lentzea pudingi]GGM80311.1 hypothetical protein GCM10011609_15260 [Lentzea pudingi]